VLKPERLRADTDSGAVTGGALETTMTRLFSMAVLCAALASPAFACSKPEAPASIPNGATAAKEEMLAAKKAVDAFKAGMEEYLSCEKSTAKQNAAQDELVKVADRFNAQVRAFKSKT